VEQLRHDGPVLGLGRSPTFPFPQWRDDDPYRTVFFDIGEGEPLVLVHGLGGNATHWELVAAELARTRRVLALDLAGCGWSAKPHVSYSVDLLRDHLLDFLRRRGVQRAALLGHSLGAAVVASAALARPGLARALALISPVGLTALPGWVDMARRLVVRRRLLFPVFRYGARQVLAGSFAQSPRRNRRVRWFVESTGTDAAGGENVHDLARFTEAILKDLARHDLSDRLGELTMPVLGLCGAADRLTVPALARLSGLPRLRRVQIPRAGHVPFVERPGRFLAELGAWL